MIRTLALSLFFAGAAWASPDADTDAEDAPEADAVPAQAEPDAPEPAPEATPASDPTDDAPTPAPLSPETLPPPTAVEAPASPESEAPSDEPQRLGNVTYMPQPERTFELKGHGVEGEAGLGPLSGSPAIASSDAGLLSFGIRGRGTVMRKGGFHLAVGGGWTHTGRRTNLFAGSVGDIDSESPTRMSTRFTLDTFNVGLRVAYTFKERLTPYVDLEGMVARGGMRVASGRVSQTDVQHQREQAVSGGADLLAGFEAILAPTSFNSPIYPAMYAAVGGRVAAPMTFGDLGTVGLSGLLVRVGMGLRF